MVVAGTGVTLGPMRWTSALHAAWSEAADGTIRQFSPQQDPAWAGHPWVQGPPGLCFLAGVDLRSRDGERMGMLCVADSQARELDTEQREALDTQVNAEQVRYKLSDLRYTNGVASYLDLLDAQRSLFTQQQAAVQVRLNQLQNQVQLYKSLGGGWVEEPVTSPPVNATLPQ